MKITVLTDNTALKDNLKREHGLSVYIEKGNTKMLFDVGACDAIRHNSQQLGVDLSKIDVIAFSHNHVDHCGGLLKIEDLINKNCWIYAHKGFKTHKFWDHSFDAITDPTFARNLELVGPAMPYEYFYMNDMYNFRTIIDDVFDVGDGIYLVGNFPIYRGVEAIFPASRMEALDGSYVIDEFRDEQACVLDTNEGLIVLTGCAHNGIMNILNTVKKHFADKEIIAVIGGTHLVPYNENRVKETLKYFNNSNFRYSGVCHCTGPAISDFAKSVNSYIRTGAGLELEFAD